MRIGILAAGCMLLCTSTSCLRVQWSKKWREEPVAVARENALRVDSSRLTEVIDTLGAPQIVRPAIRDGMWLIWAWAKTGGWSLRLSIPIRVSDVSFTWEQNSDAFLGLAIRLDKDLVLRELRRGVLSSLLKGAVDPTRERRSASAKQD